MAMLIIHPIRPYLYVSPKLVKVWNKHIHCVAPPPRDEAISFWG